MIHAIGAAVICWTVLRLYAHFRFKYLAWRYPAYREWDRDLREQALTEDLERLRRERASGR
ncbi:MAG: hypothetical protein ACTHKQ_03450 [Mesorhizobium sp.]